MITLIMNDIISAIKENIIYAIGVGLFIVCITYMINCLSSKVKWNEVIRRNRNHYILLFIFCIYCFITISITFISREPGSRDSVDLMLFSTFSKDIYNNVYPIENILLFIPMGFLLPLIWKRFYNFYLCIAAGLVISSSIEGAQYITKRGFLQTDDILTNVCGTMIGYTIAYLMTILLKYCNKV